MPDIHWKRIYAYLLLLFISLVLVLNNFVALHTNHVICRLPSTSILSRCRRPTCSPPPLTWDLSPTSPYTSFSSPFSPTSLTTTTHLRELSSHITHTAKRLNQLSDLTLRALHDTDLSPLAPEMQTRTDELLSQLRSAQIAIHGTIWWNANFLCALGSMLRSLLSRLQSGPPGNPTSIPERRWRHAHAQALEMLDLSYAELGVTWDSLVLALAGPLALMVRYEETLRRGGVPLDLHVRTALEGKRCGIVGRVAGCRTLADVVRFLDGWRRELGVEGAAAAALVRGGEVRDEIGEARERIDWVWRMLVRGGGCLDTGSGDGVWGHERNGVQVSELEGAVRKIEDLREELQAQREWVVAESGLVAGGYNQTLFVEFGQLESWW